MAIQTSELPFAVIDALGSFTIFKNEGDAQTVADGLTAQDLGTRFVVVERKDGRFLVTCIDDDDQVCWHVPAPALKARAA